MSVRKAAGVAFLLVASEACRSSMTAPANGGPVRTGVWGGAQAAATVTDAGAHFEFPCASGDVASPLTLDTHGTFSSDGVFVRSAGPARIQVQARFSGRADRQTMMLTVVLPGSNETNGPFTLGFGVAPSFGKCM